MPREATYYLRAVSGYDAFLALLNVAQRVFPKSQCQVSLNSTLMDGHVHMTVNSAKLLDDNNIKAALAHLQAHPYMICKVASVGAEQRKITYSSPDDIVGTVKIRMEDAVQPTEMLRVTDEVAKQFSFTSKADIVAASMPEHAQQNLRYQERALGELNTAVSKIGQFALEQTERQSEYLNKKQGELDERYQARLDKLEADYEQKRRQIGAREEAHSKKEAQFDARESKLVRRSLLEQIQGRIEEQKEITLSPKTIEKRQWVHGICISALVLSAALVATFAYKAMSMENVDWRFFVPVSVGTVFFIATVVYYVRWSDQWFREHAQAEFRNKQFSADILRASWLTELLFEWEKEKERELPPEVIASFTRGLFQYERMRGTDHPAELMGKALSRISDVRVTKDGFELHTRGRSRKTPNTST